jgi:hypothetical protein
MSYDYDVVLTRKDGSVTNFRIYGQSTPKGGDIITLPAHGRVIKARVSEPSQESEMHQSVDHIAAAEV